MPSEPSADISAQRSAAPGAAPDATTASAIDAGPGVDLEVVHETRYVYGSAVDLAQHIAFLTPRDDATQRLLAFGMHIDPVPPRVRTDLDVYGNARTLFALTGPHESLTVTASSRVRVRPAPARTAPAAAWEVCRERWRYVSRRPPDAATEFVFASPMLPLHRELGDWARGSFPPGRPLDEGAIELMHRLHEEFDYVPESTEVDTSVMEAFERREGVCQDFAHVLIGGLRALGLAARYVSGYLLTEPPPGQPRLQGADASHAWVAVALPGEGGAATEWLELDPTNDCVVATSHVRLALGRDYGDVTPLRGVIRGGRRHSLDVRVSTRPLDEAPRGARTAS